MSAAVTRRGSVKTCPQKFRKIRKKTPVTEPLFFDKVSCLNLQLYYKGDSGAAVYDLYNVYITTVYIYICINTYNITYYSFAMKEKTHFLLLKSRNLVLNHFFLVWFLHIGYVFWKARITGIGSVVLEAAHSVVFYTISFR